MREYSFTFTVTIRPLAWLRRCAVAGALALMAFIPVNKFTGVAADHRTIEQVQFATAQDVVERVLEARAKLPPADRTRLAAAIVRESVDNGLDPLFVLAVIENESGFDHQTRSIRCREPGVESTCYLNASGLMQVIPKTWNGEVRRRGLGHMDPLNPLDNVRIGVGYLAWNGKGFKRPESLLLAYNQGAAFASGRPPVDWTGERLEKARAEGDVFVSKVLNRYAKLLATYCNVNPTSARMAHLFRSPRDTIYSTAPYSGDSHGPDIRTPKKALKSATKVQNGPPGVPGKKGAASFPAPNPGPSSHEMP